MLAYLGVQVPETVRLIGYDGAQRGEHTDPPMTTIQQDMDRIAQHAVSRIRRIASGDKETGLLERVPPIVVRRGSF
ncbi:MAG: substrate-binding domain-containing protein [Verrucomicrobia bacterium]|nr:substrate-binding domain-containing protein [Verrucomicrobiota bacterium]